MAGSAESSYDSAPGPKKDLSQERLPPISILFGAGDIDKGNAQPSPGLGPRPTFVPFSARPLPGPSFYRTSEQAQHVGAEALRSSSSSSIIASSSLPAPALSRVSGRSLPSETSRSAIASPTSIQTFESKAKKRSIGSPSLTAAQLPGLRDLSLLPQGIPVSHHQLSSSSGPRREELESQQLLDIFYHLRSENRARGIQPGAGEVVPSTRVVDHCDYKAISQFVSNEFAAIAAREGDHVAARVARSYGLPAPFPQKSHHDGPRSSLQVSPSVPSISYYNPNSDSRIGRYSARRSPPSPLRQAPLGHPAHPHHHSRSPISALSSYDSPSSSWPSGVRSSLERRQTVSGWPGDPSSSRWSFYPQGGSLTSSSSSSLPSSMPHLGPTSAGEGNSTDSASELLRAGAMSTGPSRRSKARRRVTKREGEVPSCLGCGRLSTAEWRRGPTGPRTLCNACGLLFAKMSRVRKNAEGTGGAASTSSDGWLSLEELRSAVGASSKATIGGGSTSTNSQNITSSGRQHRERTLSHGHYHHYHPTTSSDRCWSGESSGEMAGTSKPTVRYYPSPSASAPRATPPISVSRSSSSRTPP